MRRRVLFETACRKPRLMRKGSDIKRENGLWTDWLKSFTQTSSDAPIIVLQYDCTGNERIFFSEGINRSGTTIA